MGENNHYDIIIAGAGPGGCAAALSLAGHGLKVAMIEKASFPRDKICGDAISGKVPYLLNKISPELHQAFRTLEPGKGAWGIRFIAPNEEVLDIPFKQEMDLQHDPPPGYTCKRYEFDHLLFQLVRDRTETHIMQDTQLTNVKMAEHGLIVETDDGLMQCKLLIGADGAHSVARKLLFSSKYDKKHYSAGVRAYYRGVTGFNEHHFIELHYIQDLLPGYFWIFPLAKDRANVGLGMLSHDVSVQKANLKQRLLDIVANHPVIGQRFQHATLEGKILGFGLPLGSKKRIISGKRCLLVGDAGALIDPFTGEGIGNAMISGRQAALQAIQAIEKDDYSDEFLSKYDEAVYQELWSELKLSRKIQQLVKFPWLFNFVVKKANRNESLQTMMTMMFENLDIREELRKPSFYVKLLTQ